MDNLHLPWLYFFYRSYGRSDNNIITELKLFDIMIAETTRIYNALPFEYFMESK